MEDDQLPSGPARFALAAQEAIWGARLQWARIKTPQGDPLAFEAYLPRRTGPWAQDYQFHHVAAHRLFGAAKALAGATTANDELTSALNAFELYWADIKPVRDVLAHPPSRAIRWDWLSPFMDRVEYRKPGCDPMWVYSVDALHAPLEKLYAAVRSVAPDLEP